MTVLAGGWTQGRMARKVNHPGGGGNGYGYGYGYGDSGGLRWLVAA